MIILEGCRLLNIHLLIMYVKLCLVCFTAAIRMVKQHTIRALKVRGWGGGSQVLGPKE